MKKALTITIQLCLFCGLNAFTANAYIIPDHFSLKTSTSAVHIYVSSDGNHIMQVVELDKGASLRIIDKLPQDDIPCIYEEQCDPCLSDGPFFPRQSINEFWQETVILHRNLFTLTNASHFDTNQNPTPLAFSLKVDGEIKACGYESSYPNDMLLLELYQDGSAEISNASITRSRIKDPNSAPTIIGGLSPNTNYPYRYVKRERTFIGLIENDTILILASKASTQAEATQMLKDFGAAENQIMMFDGGGSTQMVSNDPSLQIISTRNIPNCIAVLSSVDSDMKIDILRFTRSEDPIFANPSSDIFNPNLEADIEIRNGGSSYITIGQMHLEIYDASTGAKLWVMADPISGEPKYAESITLMPDETFLFGRVVSYFQDPGLFRLTARAEIDGQSGELASMNFQVFSKGNIITASQNGVLFSLDLSNGLTTHIGEIGIPEITDIAYKNSNFYGITFTQLISIDLNSKRGSVVGYTGFDDMNALAISANGIIYAATTEGEFISIEPTTAEGTLIGFYGTDLTSGGDIAFHDDGTLYASVNRRGYTNNWLATVDISTGNATLIGDIGFSNVFGLTFSDGSLYGVTSSGQVLAINSITGEGRQLFENNIQHWGMTTIDDNTIEPDLGFDDDEYTEEQGDIDADAGGNGGGGGGCFIGSSFK